MSTLTYNFSIEDLEATDNYSSLREELAIINAGISREKYIFDPDKSPLARQKNLFSKPLENKNITRQYYGIVLERRDSTKLSNLVEVFVDVPGLNKKVITHPDIFASSNIDLDFYEDLIFYYVDTYQARDPSLPIEGGVCVVEVSNYYPNHREVDKYGNRYIGMVSSTPFITISKNQERLKFGPSGIGVYGGGGAFGYGNKYSGPVGNIPRNLTQEEAIAIANSLNFSDLESFDAVVKGRALKSRTRIPGIFGTGRYSFVVPVSSQKFTEEDKKCILEAAQRTGVDPDLMMAHMFVESHMDPNALSAADAKGVGQFIDSTGVGSLMNVPERRAILDEIAARNGMKGQLIKTKSGLMYNWNDPKLKCVSIFGTALLLQGVFNYNNKGVKTDNAAEIDLAASAISYNSGRDPARQGYQGFEGSSGSSGWFQVIPKETQLHVLKIIMVYRQIQEWRRITSLPSAPTPGAGNTTTTTTTTSNASSQASTTAPARSPPRNNPMLLMNFSPDLSSSALNPANRGSRVIKAREDIIPDLQNIKNILNYYDIPLSLNGRDINLKNKFISKIAMVGLEICLNKYCGLNDYLDLEKDDYYIGPDYSYLKNDKYKLKIYGNIRKKIIKEHEKYKIINKPIEVYDLKDRINIQEPKIVKIFRPVIDITQIFEDSGFVDVKPKKQFFATSNIEDSNWNLFYKPSKITIGNTYRDVLLTVHRETSDSIWRFSNLKWDGEDFI